ncbi:hypothetical protein CPB86DRAFT_255879 [Serendipita vermifera]|nr:hypothetical protein CPB86DRAFT_255879 [Serendipita vermifera]
MALVPKLPEDLLLCIFVHGFKGDDSTFGDFPPRLTHILQETIENVTVESIVFPAYETKGELRAAVDRFVEWLEHEVLKREVARSIELGGEHKAAGAAKVVLCAHSMGGLLIADALLAIQSKYNDDGPLWPRIIALLSFDTPFLGLHPNTFKNKASEGLDYVNTAHGIITGLGALGLWGSGSNKNKAGPLVPVNPAPSSPWMRYAAIGGAVLAGSGAAATAWYHRDKLNYGWSFLTDHFKYVYNLYDQEALKQRLALVVDSTKQHNIAFRTFYAYLPKTAEQKRPRTFIILPLSSAPAASYFIAARNSKAEDEIQAHMGMFEPKTNDGYYELGLRTAQIIRESIHSLLEGEKTMRVSASDEGNEEAEFAQNRAQVEEDGREAGANVAGALPDELKEENQKENQEEKQEKKA